jgi:hypothetical protein
MDIENICSAMTWALVGSQYLYFCIPNNYVYYTSYFGIGYFVFQILEKVSLEKLIK